MTTTAAYVSVCVRVSLCVLIGLQARIKVGGVNRQLRKKMRKLRKRRIGRYSERLFCGTTVSLC